MAFSILRANWLDFFNGSASKYPINFDLKHISFSFNKAITSIYFECTNRKHFN